MIRVLVADDNPIVRHGLRVLLQEAGDISVVGEAATGAQTIRLTRQLHPDVALVDVRMPVTDGIAATAAVGLETRVVMLSYVDDHDDTVVGSIQAGAYGYLVHGQFQPAELVAAVRDVMAGHSVLSPSVVGAVVGAARGPARRARRPAVLVLTERQSEVMALVAQGWSNARIAEELHLSPKTVRNHLNEIYTRLGVNSRSEAMTRWLGAGPRTGTTMSGEEGERAV